MAELLTDREDRVNDTDLIADFRRGDVEAFNRLVQRWHGRIYNFVLRYVGDRDEAQDVAQRTFISAYGGLHRLDDASRFTSWLYQIAVNACRDAARRSQRHDMVSLERGGVAPPADPGPKTDALAFRSNLNAMLRRALQEIPEEQRVVVLMREYEGLKFREIADALAIPENTAKTRLYAGLQALRKTFDAWKLTEEMLRHEA